MMERLKYILQQYADGTATAEEVEELTARLKEEEHGELAKKLLLEYSYGLSPQMNYNVPAVDSMIQKIIGAKVVPMKQRRFSILRLTAAAGLVGILIAAALFFKRDSDHQGKDSIAVANTSQDVEAPKSSKAMITLADGKTVALDSVTSGMLAMQGGARVVKNSAGELVYEVDNSYKSSAILYNTLHNPRGSKVINLTLADGSKVWLNAESSLRYPVTFVGDERRVEITGEAYFEVQTLVSQSSGKKMPFMVAANDVLTEVLGTHFNVNAYQNEAAVKVTLLEGLVKVKSNVRGRDLESIIKPGQQALSIPNEDLAIEKNADLEKVMAWKNNEFIFENDNIATIMRELARWYDINPVITGNPSRQYVGRINRTVPLSEVLETFEKLGYIKFEIKGKDVKVITTE